MDAKPRLINQIRDHIRTLHYSYRTEQQYVSWIRHFIHFSGLRHPSTLGAPEVERFLTHLAIDRGVSASTQSQALSALLLSIQAGAESGSAVARRHRSREGVEAAAGRDVG
jgi:hypothetical protein